MHILIFYVHSGVKLFHFRPQHHLQHVHSYANKIQAASEHILKYHFLLLKHWDKFWDECWSFKIMLPFYLLIIQRYKQLSYTNVKLFFLQVLSLECIDGAYSYINQSAKINKCKIGSEELSLVDD